MQDRVLERRKLDRVDMQRVPSSIQQRAHVWEETILVQGKNHLKGLEGQWPVRQHEGEIKKFSDIKKKTQK